MRGNGAYPGYGPFAPPSARGGIAPAVKYILLANLGVYLITLLIGSGRFFVLFGLTAPEVFTRFNIFQLVTYFFVHSGLLHLLFNMFVLWVFGRELELFWGTKFFLKYYFVAGVGAGLCSVPFIWGTGIPVVGASGAIFALLV